MDESKRVQSIDIAKGLGMLLVIWGHIRDRGLGNAMIYSFHMPLFFFLSGMTYNRHKYTSIVEFIKKRIKTLIVPYAVFSVLTWFVWVGYNKLLGNEVDSYWMPLLQTIISQGSGGYLVHNSPLWFVTCLFSIELIYYFSSKLGTKWNVLVCVLCAVVGNFCILPGSPLRYMPWSIDMSLCAVPFYMIGNFVSEYYGSKKLYETINKNKIISMLFVIVAIVIIYFGATLNGNVSMGHRKLNHIYLFYPLACVGIAMHIVFSNLLSDLKSKVVLGIKWIGRNSFNAMAVQTPIKGVVLVIIGKIIHKSVDELSSSNLYSLIAFIVTLLLVIVAITVINYFIRIFKKMTATKR